MRDFIAGFVVGLASFFTGAYLARPKVNSHE